MKLEDMSTERLVEVLQKAEKVMPGWQHNLDQSELARGILAGYCELQRRGVVLVGILPSAVAETLVKEVKMENFKKEFKELLSTARKKSWDNAFVTCVIKYDKDNPGDEDRWQIISSILSFPTPCRPLWEVHNWDGKVEIRLSMNNFFLSYEELAEMIAYEIEEKINFVEYYSNLSNELKYTD